MQHRQPGEQALLRYVTPDRELIMACPHIVAVDRPGLVALYLPEGTGLKRRAHGEPSWRDELWTRFHTLRLMFDGAAHSVWLFWEGPRFLGWYVNLEAPFRRTPLGFDTTDHILDLTVHPDMTWRWKDEQQLAAEVARGAVSAQAVAAIYAEADGVIERIERRDSPFSDGWERWTPDPTWEAPSLPAGWDAIE